MDVYIYIGTRKYTFMINDVTLIRLRSPGPSNRGEVCLSDVVPVA